MSKRIMNWLPEAVVLAIAAVLRVPGIGRAPLTSAETRLWMFAGDSWEHLLRLFRLAAEPDIGTFFPYLWFLKFWSRWGDSEMWLRLPSLLAGLTAIAILYFFTKRVFSRWAGLIAALMLAAAPYHIEASRTAGATAIGVLLFMIALYYFYRIYEGEHGTATVIPFALAMLAGVNFGFYSALLILPMNVLYFGFAKDRMKGLSWWLPLNLALIGCMVFWEPRWAAAFFTQQPAWAIIEHPPIYGFLPSEHLVDLQMRLMFLDKYYNIMWTLGGFYFNNYLVNGWCAIGWLVLGISYHYFPFSGFREYEGGYRARVFVFILLVAIMCIAGVLSMTQLPLWEVLLPCAALFYAVSAHGAVKFTGWRGKSLLALMLICAVFGFVPAQRMAERSRPDWREAASFFQADPAGSVPIVLVDGGADTMPLFYYGRPFQSRIINLTADIDLLLVGKYKYRQDDVLPVIRGTVDTRPPDGVANLFRVYPQVWVVTKGAGLPEKPAWAREYMVWLQKYCDLVREKKLDSDFGRSGANLKNMPRKDLSEDTDVYLQLYQLKGIY